VFVVIRKEESVPGKENFQDGLPDAYGRVSHKLNYRLGLRYERGKLGRKQRRKEKGGEVLQGQWKGRIETGP